MGVWGRHNFETPSDADWGEGWGWGGRHPGQTVESIKLELQVSNKSYLHNICSSSDNQTVFNFVTISKIACFIFNFILLKGHFEKSINLKLCIWR